MGWKKLMEIAAGRFGVVALSDAEACGLAPATIAARAKREGWTCLHPGIHLLPGAPKNAMALTTAAVLATDGYAARRSALWLHGAVDQAPAYPQVVVPHRRRGVTGTHVDMFRSRGLPEDHLTEEHDIATTTAARAILDLAGLEHPRRLTAMVIEGERRRAVTRQQVADVRASLGRGFPGLRTVDRVLEDLGMLQSDSGWEHEVRRGMLDLGFPVHPAPFPYQCEDGVIVELDVAIPRYWVYLECDGRAYHSDDSAFETDRRRWNQIHRQWHPVHVTYDQWRYERAAVVANVRRAIELADPNAAPAVPAR